MAEPEFADRAPRAVLQGRDPSAAPAFRHAALERRLTLRLESDQARMLNRPSGPVPVQRMALSGNAQPIQRFIELGRPHDPRPVENGENQIGKIRHKDGSFQPFDSDLWAKGMAYRDHHYQGYFGFEEDRVSQIRKWLKDEKGVELDDGPAADAVLYTMEISHLPLEQIDATTCGGSSLTLFPQGKDYVVQYFRRGAFANIKIMYEALQGADPELKRYVAEIRSIDDSRRIAVMERIKPLNAIFDFFGQNAQLASVADLRTYVGENAAALKAAGMAAITGLASLGVSQGDVSFDNMGIKGDQFALFDYDKARRASDDTVEADTASLGKSFKSRGGLDMNKVK
jgi:hypothetical protein